MSFARASNDSSRTSWHRLSTPAKESSHSLCRSRPSCRLSTFARPAKRRAGLLKLSLNAGARSLRSSVEPV